MRPQQTKKRTAVENVWWLCCVLALVVLTLIGILHNEDWYCLKPGLSFSCVACFSLLGEKKKMQMIRLGSVCLCVCMLDIRKIVVETTTYIAMMYHSWTVQTLFSDQLLLFCLVKAVVCVCVTVLIWAPELIYFTLHKIWKEGSCDNPDW